MPIGPWKMRQTPLERNTIANLAPAPTATGGQREIRRNSAQGPPGSSLPGTNAEAMTAPPGPAAVASCKSTNKSPASQLTGSWTAVKGLAVPDVTVWAMLWSKVPPMVNGGAPASMMGCCWSNSSDARASVVATAQAARPTRSSPVIRSRFGGSANERGCPPAASTPSPTFAQSTPGHHTDAYFFFPPFLAAILYSSVDTGLALPFSSFAKNLSVMFFATATGAEYVGEASVGSLPSSE